ncbi:MAG: Lrp/AsnC ligand binding domain-containing protein [Pseudomonadota bacterium]
MKRELDGIDVKILSELESDGRLSIVDLAQRVNLTNTPCSERVKRLERSGFIQGYRAITDKHKLGFGHLTIVQVALAASATENVLAKFNEAVRRIDEVELCLMIAGSFDYLLLVRTSDMAEFRVVLDEKVNKLPGILNTNSFAVMEAVKDAHFGMVSKT